MLAETPEMTYPCTLLFQYVVTNTSILSDGTGVCLWGWMTPRQNLQCGLAEIWKLSSILCWKEDKPPFKKKLRKGLAAADKSIISALSEQSKQGKSNPDVYLFKQKEKYDKISIGL